MKDQMREIFERLLEDANSVKEDRFYSLSDAQLIYACNSLGEYFMPKEVRTSTDESRANTGVIEIEYVKGKSTISKAS